MECNELLNAAETVTISILIIGIYMVAVMYRYKLWK